MPYDTDLQDSLRLYLKIPYDRTKISRLKSVGGGRWLKDHKLWVFPDTDTTRRGLDKFGLLIHECDAPQSLVGNRTDNKLIERAPTNTKVRPDPVVLTATYRNRLLQCEEEMRLKRYSWRTIKSYLSHLRTFSTTLPKSNLLP